VSGPPRLIMKRHVFVNPFHEEDIEALPRIFGPSQVVVGLDYSQGEGVAEMVSFAQGHLTCIRLRSRRSPDAPTE
jgi:hypothetical protein